MSNKRVPARQKQPARLCNVARNAEPWRVGRHLRSKLAKDRSLRSVTLCGEFRKPQDEGGGTGAPSKNQTKHCIWTSGGTAHLSLWNRQWYRRASTRHSAPSTKSMGERMRRRCSELQSRLSKMQNVRCLEMRPLARGNWKIRMSHEQRGATQSGSRQLFKERTWTVALSSKYVPRGTDTHMSKTSAHILKHSKRSARDGSMTWERVHRHVPRCGSEYNGLNVSVRTSRAVHEDLTNSATRYAGNPHRG